MSDESVDLGCLPNGAHLSRKPNGVGGYIYYSDEIGGGVLIWDTCLVSQHTLLCAISHENKRRFDKCVATDEVNKKKRIRWRDT